MAVRRQRGGKAGTQAAAASSPVPPLRYDLTFGDPWRIAAVERLQSGDWRQLADFATYVGRDVRHQLDVTTQVQADHEPVVRAWAEHCPGDLLASCALGQCLIEVAWAAHGSGRASTVSDGGFQRFWEVLREADAVLVDAGRSHPDSGLPWAMLAPCSRGLQLPLEEAKDRYARAEALLGLNWTAVSQMLQVVCEKWSGSDAEMFDFARDVARRAPEGDPLHAVIALAYAEFFLGDPSRAGAHPEHLHEVQWALDRSRLLDPTWRADPEGYLARNAFAYTLAKCGDRDRSLALLAQLGWDGRRLSLLPWAYDGGARPLWEFGRAGGVW